VAIDPASLLRRYHAALNLYDAEVVKAFFAPDAVYVSPGIGGSISGRDNIIAAFTAYFAEHPDQHAVDDWIETIGESVAQAGWQLEATSKSSGQVYARRGTETIRFDGNGLIVHVSVEDT
jgi:uncharacterized protein (TIGR02246 family)